MISRTQAKIVLPIVVLLLAGAIFHVLFASKPEASKPRLTEKVWLIDTIQASLQELAPGITLYGRIESPEQLKAAAPGSGIVERVYVRDGTRVESGQPLVTLDKRDFEASLLQYEADLRDIGNQIAELKIRHQANLAALETERELMSLAEAEVERLVKLQKQNLSADTALNAARSELGRQQLTVMARKLDVDSYPARLQILMARRDRDQALLNQSRLAMERSELSAPFDAIVSEVTVSAGDRVSMGQILVSLFPLRDLEIRAHLPLNYIESVQRALADGFPLQAIAKKRPDLGALRVARLAGEAEATGIDLYFELDAPGGQIRPGELLALNLQLPPEAGVYAVPYQAIYGNSRIYRVVDERLQAIDVQTVGQSAGSAGDQVVVLIRSDEISPGDEIAVTHLPNAVTGLKVKVDE